MILGDNEIIVEQYNELRAKHTGLQLTKTYGRSFLIHGLLGFTVEYQGAPVQDAFVVEIIVPEDYPISLPVVREAGGRIPDDFHIYPYSKYLCLGSPLGVRKEFLKNPTLLGFVDNCIVPFLFSFSVFKKTGEMPYGGLSHGGEGIYEFYRDLFGVSDINAILELLDKISGTYRGHHPCPCGSGNRLRKCHGQQLLDIKRIHKSIDLKYEFMNLLEYRHRMNEKQKSALLSDRMTRCN